MGGTAVGTSSSVSITKPTGVASGDLILALMESSGPSGLGLPTPPAGFTTIDSRTDTPAGQSAAVVAYKVAGGSEPASYTWTQGANSTFNVWSCIALRGQDGTTPIDAHGTAFSTTTSVSVAALTASVAGDALVLLLTDINDVDVSTWPSGVSENASASNPAGNGVVCGTKLSLASGSTGALAMTMAAAPGGVQAFGVLVKAPASGTAWNQALSDKTSSLDTRTSSPAKRPSDFLSALDSLLKTTTSSRAENFSQTDSPAKNVTHLLPVEAISSTESRTAARGALWTIVEKFSSSDSITQRNLTKTLLEALSGLDSQRFATTHQLAEFLVLTDVLSKLPSHLLQDAASSTDSLTRGLVSGAQNYKQTLSDSLSALDARTAAATKPLSDSQSATDGRQMTAGKALQDATSATDKRVALLVKLLAENLVFVDGQSWNVVHKILENFSQTEKLVAGRALLKALQDWFVSTDVAQETKQQALAKGLLAVLSLTISSLLGVSLAISTSASIAAVIAALRHAVLATTGLSTQLASSQTLVLQIGVNFLLE